MVRQIESPVSRPPTMKPPPWHHRNAGRGVAVRPCEKTRISIGPPGPAMIRVITESTATLRPMANAVRRQNSRCVRTERSSIGHGEPSLNQRSSARASRSGLWLRSASGMPMPPASATPVRAAARAPDELLLLLFMLFVASW